VAKKTWPAERQWTVRTDPETGVLDRDEVIRALIDAEAMGHRFGGVFQAIPSREPVAPVQGGLAGMQSLPDEHMTTGWVFYWSALAPRPRRPEPEGPDEDESLGDDAGAAS